MSANSPAVESSATEHSGKSAPVLPGLAWRTGLVLTLLVTLLLMLSEIDRLSGQMPAPLDGRVHPIGQLVAPRLTVDAWRAALSDTTGVLSLLLGAHLVVDTFFVALYATLGLWLTSRSAATKWIGWALLGTAAVDLLENSLIVVARFLGASGPVLPVLVGVTLAKWLLVALTVFAAIRALQAGWGSVVEWAKTAGFAVRIQRFSVLVLAVLVLLSLVPRDGVFDQLPDAQRSWPESPKGWLQFVAAVVVLLVIAAAMFIMGRLRTQHLLDEQKRGSAAQPAYSLYLWLVGPLVLWVLAILEPGAVLWGRLAITTGVLLVIAVSSYALRRRRRRRGRPPRLDSVQNLATDQIHAAAQLGDMVAVGLIAASGVGLVRAFIGPLILGLSPGWSIGFTLFGLVTGLAVWPAAAWTLEKLQDSDSDSRLRTLVVPGRHVWSKETLEQSRWRRGVIPTLSIVTGLAMLFVAGSPAVSVLGVSATVMLATGLIALFIGGLVVLGQDLRPPELLACVGFRTTPVALLLVVLLLIANLSPANTEIHGLRMLPGAISARPSMVQAFSDWLTATDGCGRTTADGVRWRPLVLYAAEGGGIRAAYWTARGIDIAGEDDPRCAAAFLSGGASGGAVGLTVSQVSAEGRAGEAVTALSRSDGLAKASLGMVLRDVLRAGTGLPLTLGSDDGWQDRAALREGAWEQDVPELKSAYLGGNPPGQPGNLVLNTTAVSSGCRTFLSQVALAAGSSSKPGECDGDQAPGGRSVDFFARDAAARCVGALRASTAALTASRFPYVTPAAAIGCPGENLDQLVDGGYVENSGLGTLADLWPELSALLRAHNDAASNASGQDLIVPLVVYLTNSPGADLAPPGRPITAELLVPPVAFLRASGAQSSPPALLQRLREATDGAEAGGLLGTGAPGLPERRVFVVYPATRPAISAPLGWTLSGMSRASMDQAMTSQKKARCGDLGVRSGRQAVDSASWALVCERGYGTLGDLVGALRG